MGMGALVEGFDASCRDDHDGYNHPWYGPAMEAEGFTKLRDQLSMYIEVRDFKLPDRIRRVAEIAMKRGSFEVPEFRSKRDLVRNAAGIGRVYNESFSSHGDEFYPLSEREIGQITSDLVTVADPSLIKLLVSKGEIAGFLFGFPDLSAALQRSHGRITPWGIIDLLLEYRRTRWLIVNGAGILRATSGSAGTPFCTRCWRKSPRASGSSTSMPCRSRSRPSSCSRICGPWVPAFTRSTASTSASFRGPPRRTPRS